MRRILSATLLSATLLFCLSACDLSGDEAAPPGGLTAAEAPFGLASSDPFLPSYVGFAVIGHSNAVGKGDSTISRDSTVIPTNASFQYRRSSGSFAPLRDPVGDANTGSAWPSFAREFYDRTCRGSFIVPIAQRGSYLATESDLNNSVNYWVRSENPADNYHRLLLSVSYQAYNAARAQGGSRVSWGGVVMWLGNGDADNIPENPLYTADSIYAVYGRAFTSFLDAYAEDIGVGKVYVITDIAEIVNGQLVDHPEFQEVRRAQRDVCAAHPFCVLASDEGHTYPLEEYEDAKHLNQFGLLKIGRDVGASAAAEIGPLNGCTGTP